MGAFVDEQVHGVLELAEEERPLIIMPVG